MATFLHSHGPNSILSSFLDRTRTLNPVFNPTHFVNLQTQKPLLRGGLSVTRFGLGQAPFPDPENAEVLIKDLFGRVEGLLYTVADAAVSGSADTVLDTTEATKRSSDWFSGISNGMETVLKVLKDGLSALHVPYAYGFAIVLLTILVKAATFPLTKKQVESSMAMRSLAPQIKAIQERYAGDQERIQHETARIYKLAGINPLAGCLPTLATVPIWIGLYRALSNVANEGLLTEGFFWIPSLAGPTTIAAQQTGSGISWLFPFVDGQPPLGWSDTCAYLVLPVLLIISQYISIQIMQPSQQSNDPNLKSSQAITKFLPIMIGYFALSVPSGLSLYWFTNNILSTAQQVWLQKLGGAKFSPRKHSDDTSRKQQQPQIQQPQFQKTVSEATTVKKKENLTSHGLPPGERFKRLKEQEAIEQRQKAEEKRKAEELTARENQISVGKHESEGNLAERENRIGTDSINVVKEDQRTPDNGRNQHVLEHIQEGETVTSSRGSDKKLSLEDVQEDRSE